MRFLHRLVCALALVACAAPTVVAAPLREEQLPAALRDWVDWANYEQGTDPACALVSSSEGEDVERGCAWPGALAITADDDGARFTVTWTVYSRVAVGLPGSADVWPQDVTADGRAIAVVPDADGQPVAWLDPGRYAMSGTLAWSDRPESLRVPGDVALIALTLDGKPVFPLQREDDQLWLGAADTAEREADSMDVQVFRHLADGLPAILTTRLVLDISGSGREEILGRPLPSGWQPIALSGDLPARIDADGSLRVQARPGTYTLTLSARATTPLASLTRADAGSEAWPAQEVWSYLADPRLRVTVAEGPPAMDPAQAGVPSEWSALPAFLMEGDATLTIAERSRGLSAQDQNRLTLSRRLWLDFDGDGWTARDRIAGEMVRDWRLDVVAPYAVTRAETGGEGLLVTHGAAQGRSGVELRDRGVTLDAGLRIDAGAGGTLPVAGWQQAFESVGVEMQLPPGYRLYAAFGVDDAPQAWISRWQLLDVFLVAFTSLLAFWLLRWPLAALVAAYLVLGYHEVGAPVYGLLTLLALTLIVRALPFGKFRTFMGVTRWVWLALMLFVVLPFAYTQVRLALHPQLERDDEAAWASIGMIGGMAKAPNDYAYDEPMPMAEAAPPPPPAPMVQADSNALESVVVAGSRSKRVELQTSQPQFQVSRENMRLVRQRYANNASIQAGGGEPNWTWRGYSLRWSGPVLPTQEMQLVISPPWLTRVLRLLVLGLLVTALVQILRLRLRRPPDGDLAAPATTSPRAAATAAVFAAVLATAGATSTVRAQAIPSDELLSTLHERVSALPDCAPSCGTIARARVSASGDTLRIALELHAAERVALPLPFDESLLAVEQFTVDGVAGGGVLRRNDGEAWIVVERGVHQAQMTLRAADADKIALRFPLSPGEVVFDGAGWESNGLRDSRLLTDTLELVRVRDAGHAAGVAATAAQQFPPFVRVTRDLDLDLDWSVTTRVQRIAPAEAGFSVTVPLLAGERVMSADFPVREGRVTVPIQAGEYEQQWDSQLARNDTITLVAPDLGDRAEVWRIRVSPTWNLRYEGVPVVYPPNAGGEWIHEFHPLPGEKLVLTVVRPEAVVGKTVAIDSVQLISSVGQRAREHVLSLTLRSTQGGQHVVTIPADGELLSLLLDGQPLNVRPEDGRLGLPLHPGQQTAVITWREALGPTFVTRTPAVGVGAPASNLTLGITLPENRWLIGTRGPRIGPAVLYWGELIAMGLIAWGLSRIRRTPLRFHDWLLLGLGFSTFSWPALVIFGGWLFLLDARCRWANTTNRLGFVLGQIGLALLSVIALVVLVGALWRGLLGEPDMHVVGNDSWSHSLRWFHDQTDDALPSAAAFSLSLWWYKAAMLAWALWLAAALGRWLRWGWDCFGAGGYWRELSDGRRPPPQTPVTMATTTTTTTASGETTTSTSTTTTTPPRDG